jgi:hypothetical protein
MIAIFWLTGCLSVQANAPTVGTELILDPVYRDFYLSMGGEPVLGPVISASFPLGNYQAQFVEKALLLFDFEANESKTIQLKPIGNLLFIAEKPLNEPQSLPDGWLYINGHIIPKEFADVYLRLGGMEKVGMPLTEVRFNPAFRRYEQYYEKIGLYRLKSDPLEAVNLLGYGEWLCGDNCSNGNDQNDAVDILVPGHKSVADLILSVDVGFTGYVIEENRTENSNEIILTNMLLSVDQQEPGQVNILPLTELVGVQPDPPTTPHDIPGMVFIPVNAEGQGYHIPQKIYDYIMQHGGFEISGLPVSHYAEYVSFMRQCFTNMCILVDPQPKYQEIYPDALGYMYRKIYHRKGDLPDENQTGDSSIEEKILIFPGGRLAVWEEFPVLPQDQVQIINVELAFDDAGSNQELEGRMSLQVPGKGEVMVRSFQINPQKITKIDLPVFVFPNGTLIPYEVCVFSAGKEYCQSFEFVIWNAP